MVLIVNPTNIHIYTRRNQDKALTDFSHITYNLERTLTRLCTQNPGNWKELNRITNKANTLTDQHNIHTKRIFIHLTDALTKCPYKGMEKPNFFVSIIKRLKEMVQILSYRGHPQRHNKQNKEMTCKLNAFKSKNEIIIGLSHSSMVTRQILTSLANYLIKMINIIRAEE